MGKEIESSTIKTADMILASCVVAIIIVSVVGVVEYLAWSSTHKDWNNGFRFLENG